MSKSVNFGGLPKEYSSLDNSKVVVVPVPYDGTSTWVKGADKGPAALLDASANMELYDIETDSEVYKQGIFTDKPVTEKSSPEKMTAAVKARVKKFLDMEKFVVLLGGEHSVSIGTIQAHAEKYKDMSVLQLDAHGDTREEYHGSKNNHACIMARAREICPIAQVGIRSIDTPEIKKMDKSRVFFAENIYNNKAWIKKVLSKLTKNVYITIDLDVFDPSLVPSTGTPEPGGLFWYDVIELMREVVTKKNLVGLDVVELCPNKENKSSDFVASKLVYKILSYKYEL
jgi:agmatinase